MEKYKTRIVYNFGIVPLRENSFNKPVFAASWEITSPTKFEFAGEMIEGEKKGKNEEKRGKIEYPSLTQEQKTIPVPFQHSVPWLPDTVL